MKKLLIVSGIFCSFLAYSQSFIQAYADRANQVSQTNINTGLQEFVSYGVKTTGSTNNNNALNWLKSKYNTFGYSAVQVVENPFSFGSTNSKNLVVTKTGTLYPNTFVIVTAHFDTVSGVGANDNGSGTNAILEIARILKDVPTEYSIKFIHFSGEEQGLYGSQHYVSNVVNATTPKMDIKVVFNLDQVGGVAGQSHNTIICEKDNSNPTTNNAASATKTQELITCVGLYSPLQTVLANAYSSDYMPFQSNNEVITGFYEYQGGSNPHPHTATDVIANMDPVYLFNVTKAAIGAVQHFAVASTSLSTNELQQDLAESIIIYPNPAKDFIEIKLNDRNIKKFSFELIDFSGKMVLKTDNEQKINVSGLENGNYLATIKANDKVFTKKIIIKK